jgi:hypothetical protein
MFSWLYDIKLDARGIRFVLFGAWTEHILLWDNIKGVSEIGALSPGSISAYNFKNRFLARSFLLETKRGWFTHKVLVTPREPDHFVEKLRSCGVTVTTR